MEELLPSSFKLHIESKDVLPKSLLCRWQKEELEVHSFEVEVSLEVYNPQILLSHFLSTTNFPKECDDR